MEITKLNIHFSITDELFLPPFKGSMVRGAFGNVFRKIVCPFKNKECKECLLKTKCVYTYVFETPVPEGSKIMRKYEHIPHPFVIEPPLDSKTEYKKHDELIFNLLLIGKSIDYLLYFIYAFEMIGETGLGKKKQKSILLRLSKKMVLFMMAKRKP
ncbi:MAG: hypothetical protein ACPL28_11495 [bacterium]